MAEKNDITNEPERLAAPDTGLPAEPVDRENENPVEDGTIVISSDSTVILNEVKDLAEEKDSEGGEETVETKRFFGKPQNDKEAEEETHEDPSTALRFAQDDTDGEVLGQNDKVGEEEAQGDLSTPLRSAQDDKVGEGDPNVISSDSREIPTVEVETLGETVEAKRFFGKPQNDKEAEVETRGDPSTTLRSAQNDKVNAQDDKENVQDDNNGAAAAAVKRSKPKMIAKIVGYTLLAVVLALMLLNTFLTLFKPHYYTTFGKYRLFAIVTDSMEPEIMTGDMIVCTVPVSEEDITVGTVITYEYKDGNTTRLITHRVTRIVMVEATGEIAYYTKGDNAPGVDAVHPTFSDVVGIYTGQHCGFFGYLFGFLQSTNGAIALIVIMLILVLWIIVSQYVDFLSLWKKLTAKVLGKSREMLFEDEAKAMTVSDAIGIIISEPKNTKDAKRKEKKLLKYIEDGVLPERPWDDDDWIYGDIVKKVKEAQTEAEELARAVAEWKKLSGEVLEKSKLLLAEDDSKAGTVSDAINMITTEPKTAKDAALKVKKLRKFIEEGVLPSRPWNDDECVAKEDGEDGEESAETKRFFADAQNDKESEADPNVILNEVKDLAEEKDGEDVEETVETKRFFADAQNDKEDEGDPTVISSDSREIPTTEDEETEIEEPEFVEAEQLLTAEQILMEAEEIPEDEEPEFEVLPEEDEPQEEVRSVDKLTGMAVIVRYRKSFTAKLIQSDDKVKAYYSMLKNAMLSYDKVKSRTSWNHENFNCGRSNIARFSIRGKSLCVYFALDPQAYADTKYKVEYAQSKKYENIPCMFRIKNARRAKYALDLIAALAEKYGLEKGEEQRVNYYLHYEPTGQLIERGLIKELVSEEDYNEFMRVYSRKEVDRKRREFISAKDVNAVIADDVAIALVEDKREESHVQSQAGKNKAGRKGIINVDTLSENYGKNQTVTLENLKEKGLIAKNVGFVKVLARGTLSKPLTVEAQDFSIEAIKMIVLTGGKATKV